MTNEIFTGQHMFVDSLGRFQKYCGRESRFEGDSFITWGFERLANKWGSFLITGMLSNSASLLKNLTEDSESVRGVDFGL